MERQYPCLQVDLSLLRSNAREIMSRCRAAGIEVCGVIKGCNGIPPVARVMKEEGDAQLGTSRIEQVIACREAGIPGPYLLLRVPAVKEVPSVVRWCDISLQSERRVLTAIEEECKTQNKRHAVIIMADLGDLREGFWDKDDMVATCIWVEQSLLHVDLLGVGVNLGCYGSVQPTPEKMNDLLQIAHRVEAQIGRKLDVVSGGATSSFSLVHLGTMPAGINHLRIGENMLTAHDLPVDWGMRNMTYLRRDAFVLQAEVLEVKVKPSYPQGSLAIDAFGNRPTYTDIGMRRRALLSFGRADVGAVESLTPLEPGMTVVGGSSDHCIVDVTNCREDLQVGDVVSFHLSYSHMLYASSRRDMNISIIE